MRLPFLVLWQNKVNFGGRFAFGKCYHKLQNKKTCFYFIFSGLKYLLYVLLHSHMRLADMSGVTAIGHGDTEAGNIMPIQ